MSLARASLGGSVLVAVIGTGACGGHSPAAPSSQPPAVIAPLPQAGAYVVSVSPTSGFMQPQFIACGGFGSLVGDSATFPVTMAVSESGFTMRSDAPDDFFADLKLLTPGTVTGPVSGQARDPQTGVLARFLNAPPAQTASLTGSNRVSGDANIFSGMVDANVELSLNGSSRSCTPNQWIVKPR